MHALYGAKDLMQFALHVRAVRVELDLEAGCLQKLVRSLDLIAHGHSDTDWYHLYFGRRLHDASRLLRVHRREPGACRGSVASQ